MPSRSEAQRRALYAKKGKAWMDAHPEWKRVVPKSAAKKGKR